MADKKPSIWDVPPGMSMKKYAEEMAKKDKSATIASPNDVTINPGATIRNPTWGEKNPNTSEFIQELPRSILTTALTAGGGFVGGPAGAAAGFGLGEVLGGGAKYGMKAAAPDLFGPKEAYDLPTAASEIALDTALGGTIPALKFGGRKLRDSIIGTYAKEDPYVKNAFKWFLNENPEHSVPMTAILGEDTALSRLLRNTSLTKAEPIKQGYATTRGQISDWFTNKIGTTSSKSATSDRIRENFKRAYTRTKATVDNLYSNVKGNINAVVQEIPNADPSIPPTRISGPIQFTKWDSALTDVLSNNKTDPDIRAMVKDIRLDDVNKLLDDTKLIFSKYYPTISEGPLAKKFNEGMSKIQALVKGGVVAYDDLENVRMDLNGLIKQLDLKQLPSGVARQFKGSLKLMAGLIEKAELESIVSDPRYSRDIIPDLLHAKERYTKFLQDFPRANTNINNLLTDKVPGTKSATLNYDADLDSLFKTGNATESLVKAVGNRDPDLRAGYMQRLMKSSFIEDANSPNQGYWSGTRLIKTLKAHEGAMANRLLSSDERAALNNLAVVMERTNDQRMMSLVGSQAGLFLQMQSAARIGAAVAGGGLAYALANDDGIKMPTGIGTAALILTGLTMAPNQLAKFATSARNTRLLAGAMQTPASSPAAKSKMRQLIKAAAGKGIRITAQLANGNQMDMYVDESGNLVPINNENNQ